MPRLHTSCKFDNQVPSEKLVQKYVCVVKVTQQSLLKKFMKRIESLLKITDTKFEF